MTIAPHIASRSLANTRHRLAVLAMITLTATSLACGGGGGKTEIEVAQVAVRANPALELVATDTQQGVLTVRVKATGQVLTVKAADVNAGTAFQDLAAEAVATSPATTAAPAMPAGQGVSSSTNVSAPGVSVSATRETRVTGDTGESTQKDLAVKSAGGVAVEATSTTSSSGTASRTRVTTPGGVTIDVPGTGGATVTTGGRRTGPAAPASTAPQAASPAPAHAAAQTAVADLSPMFDESKLERRTTPASCRAGQDASLVGVLLETGGVAVTVGGGCNMRIRGSLIVGGDTAIVVENGGNLWVEGSDVQSGGVSVRLEGGSNGYLGKSLFRGRVATQAGANMFDQGGNTFK
jgi:hypothetical protein